MKITARFLSIFFAAFLLHGCSTTGQGVGDDFSFSNNPNIGLYAFALRWDRKCEKNIPLIPVHAKAYISGGKELEFLNIENPFLSEDFKNPPGYFYIFGKEPGKRKLDKVTLVMDHNNYRFSFKPITFNIYKGKLNYLGELYIKAENCRKKVIRNIELPVGDATIRITDQWERDKKFIIKRLKNIKNIKVVKQLMKQ